MTDRMDDDICETGAGMVITVIALAAVIAGIIGFAAGWLSRS